MNIVGSMTEGLPLQCSQAASRNGGPGPRTGFHGHGLAMAGRLPRSRAVQSSMGLSAYGLGVCGFCRSF